jgi:peroxiredoxin
MTVKRMAARCTRALSVFRTLPLVLTAALGAAQAESAGLPLLGSCDDANDVKATIQKSDTVRIRFSMAGSGQECYSVSASVDGRVLDGYLLGADHPAIAEFERMRSRQPAIMPYVPPPPPPPEAEKPAAAAAPSAVPQPVSLAGMRGVDVNGRPVDLDRMKAKTIIVYFWSPGDRRGVKDAEMLDYVYQQYQPKSVEIVGVASGSSAQVKQICGKNEVVWPQVMDSGRIAQQYHVDPAKPYILLDQQRNVVATLSSATQIDAVLQQRLKAQ